jgi:hypothetical protein
LDRAKIIESHLAKLRELQETPGQYRMPPTPAGGSVFPPYPQAAAIPGLKGAGNDGATVTAIGETNSLARQQLEATREQTRAIKEQTTAIKNGSTAPQPTSNILPDTRTPQRLGSPDRDR